MKTLKLLIPLLAITLFSCSENYLDVNDTPNSATGENVTPNLILAAAHANSYRTMATTANELGNVWMNSWGANINAFTGGYADEYSLSISNAFYTGIWDNIYLNTANYTNIINSSFPNYENHKAIAKIMKSYYFQYLVDLYGDIPYTEAHKATGNLFPAYDDAQTIYRDLYDKLDEAIVEIQNAPSTALPVGAEDVILNGNMNRWITVANTLKLKILVRQMELAQTDAATQTYLTEKFGQLVASNAQFVGAGITENVTINPGYSNARAAQQNPFYNRWGLALNGSAVTTNFNFTRASDNAAQKLNTNFPDPRRQRLFNTTANVAGVKQGAAAGANPVVLTAIGPGLAPTTGVGTAAGATTAATGSAMNGYILTSAESLLLQAEAVQRGYLAGNAKALFQSAITQSCLLLGVTAANAATYNTGINSVAGKGWDGSTNKIEAIMYQKWVALMGINGIESFIEYTRTGFPRTPRALTAQYPSKPNRLMYPVSEVSGNAANVPPQTLADVFSTFIFWDVTPPVAEPFN